MTRENDRDPPGWPGIPARWTSSAKSGVGTQFGPAGRVWFTVSHGILNEIYYPRVDQACTRDMGFVVTDGAGFFSEEKRDARHELSLLAEGVPAFRLVNTCEGRYRIEKEVIADPEREVVLQRVRFRELGGAPAACRLFALLAPHLGNRGAGNTGWVGEYKGTPMLFAERDGTALALASSTPWLARSAGFVGVSDGWRDLSEHGRLTWAYERAEDGNVALAGELDLVACADEFVLAIGFGRTATEAAHRVRASLADGFESAASGYVARWQEWQGTILPLASATEARPDRYRMSAAMLSAHEAKEFPGGIIASLSVPWGSSKGDDDLGGYHLVWPRDLVETAGGLLALGAHEDARRVLRYLAVTQEPDGRWPQNMWLDGTAYWGGVQIDEAAFPVLLVDLARREGALDAVELARLYPMVRRAAGFVARNGPVTLQDRWEEDPGYSPFTLAVEVAALLSAADLADEASESEVAGYFRETADAWNDEIERWTYASGNQLALEAGVAGYYVRISPPDEAEAASPLTGFVPIKNRPPGQSKQPAALIVSPDALALVRFGLRAPDDSRILDTVKVVDDLLRVETPAGPAWRRYNEDGYGEHEDGRPFDGTGRGRAWPLLTGERAHYELAAGRRHEAEQLARTFESFANEGGLLPEQVWDAPDIPDKELFRGRPSGSAMPLVWAHAEHVKLLRSLRDGRVFDMPSQTVRRYVVEGRCSPHAFWRFNHRRRSMKAGKLLRIEVQAAARVHWSSDNWRTVANTETSDTGLGVHVADLDTVGLPPGSVVRLTFYWRSAERYEGTDFEVSIADSAARPR